MWHRVSMTALPNWTTPRVIEWEPSLGLKALEVLPRLEGTPSPKPPPVFSPSVQPTELLQSLEQWTQRLQTLLKTLEGRDRFFTPGELLRMQAEIHVLTLRIEWTTRVMAEAAHGIRSILQPSG